MSYKNIKNKNIQYSAFIKFYVTEPGESDFNCSFSKIPDVIFLATRIARCILRRVPVGRTDCEQGEAMAGQNAIM